MSEPRKHPPGRGHAWRGDWKKRLHDLLTAKGFSSATEYIDGHPTASMLELARDLGAGDVAPVQLQWAYVEEAENSGTMAKCARSLLAREIRRSLPAGWDRSDDFHGGAYGTWAAALPETLEESTLEVWRALENTMPQDRWLPSGPDDPLLVDIFERHWPIVG